MASKSKIDDMQSRFSALTEKDCLTLIDMEADDYMMKKKNDKEMGRIDERVQALIPVNGPSNKDIKILNIFLLGKTGTGKSTIGNLLLDGAVFKEHGGAGAGTTTFSVREFNVNGVTVRVADTPGSLDAAIPADDIAIEMLRVALRFQEGIHAILFIRNLGNTRFTEEEIKAFHYIESVFSKEALDHCVFVWSRAHEIFQMKDLKDKNIDGYRTYSLSTTSSTVQTFIQKVKGIYNSLNNRVIGVENGDVSPYEKRTQREKLVSYLLTTVAGPDKRPFVSEAMKDAQLFYKSRGGNTDDYALSKRVAEFFEGKSRAQILEYCSGNIPREILDSPDRVREHAREFTAQAETLSDEGLLSKIGDFVFSFLAAAGSILPSDFLEDCADYIISFLNWFD